MSAIPDTGICWYYERPVTMVIELKQFSGNKANMFVRKAPIGVFMSVGQAHVFAALHTLLLFLHFQTRAERVKNKHHAPVNLLSCNQKHIYECYYV